LATVSGGWTNFAGATTSSIGGGYGNIIPLGADSSVIAGGYGNSATANYSAILGGIYNDDAGFVSSIGGGQGNTIQGSSAFSVIGGGFSNTVSGTYSVIPGGDWNSASGTNSLAAGHRAKANHQGGFVWADSTEADFASTSSNQFLIRASGGVGIGTTNPSGALDVAGSAHVSGNMAIGAFPIIAVSTNVPAASSTLTPTTGFVKLNPASSVTLNATTAIAGAANPGTLLILQCVSSSFTVTINDNANTRLSIAHTLGLNDTLTLLWDGSVWVELSFANN
jgi:hypothetical protein